VGRTLWAVFKIRGVGEHQLPLSRTGHLVANGPEGARLRLYAPRVAAMRDAMPDLCSDVIEDGSGDRSPASTRSTEAAMAEGSPERDFAPRSGDDRYILYTGGTTELPKGVLWRHEDVFRLGGIAAEAGNAAARGHDRAGDAPGPRNYFSLAPLMHGATQWSVMSRPSSATERWSQGRPGRKRSLPKNRCRRARWSATRGASARRSARSVHRARPPRSSSSPPRPSSHRRRTTFRHFNLIIVDGVGVRSSGNGLLLCTKGKTAMIGGGPA
jgi:hypothetical protein